MRDSGRRRGARAECLAILGDVHWRQGDPPRAAFEQLEEAIDGLTKPSYAKAYALAELARMRNAANQPRTAIALGHEALAIADELDLESLAVSVLTTTGIARTLTGDDGGIDDLRRSVEAAEEIASPESVRAYYNLGAMLGIRGQRWRRSTPPCEGRRGRSASATPRGSPGTRPSGSTSCTGAVTGTRHSSLPTESSTPRTGPSSEVEFDAAVPCDLDRARRGETRRGAREHPARARVRPRGADPQIPIPRSRSGRARRGAARRGRGRRLRRRARRAVYEAVPRRRCTRARPRSSSRLEAARRRFEHPHLGSFDLPVEAAQASSARPARR